MNKQDIPDRALVQLRNHLINEAEDYDGDYPCRFNFEYIYDCEDGSSWLFEGETKAIVEDTRNGLEFVEFDYVCVDRCLFVDEWGEDEEVEFDDERFENPNPKILLQVAEEQVAEMKERMKNLMGGFDPIEEFNNIMVDTFCHNVAS